MFVPKRYVCVFFLITLLILQFTHSSTQDAQQETTTSGNDPQVGSTASPENISEKTLELLESLKQNVMKGWYIFTNAFLDSVNVNFDGLIGTVSDIVTKTRENSGENVVTEYVKEVTTKLMNENSGIMTCIVVGLLYVIVMILLLLLLPCFRICCNLCGGKRSQLVTKKTDRWRVVNTVILVVVIGVMATACTAMMIASASIYTVIGQSNTTLIQSMQLVTDYTSSVSKELKDSSQKPLGKLNSSISEVIDEIEVNFTDAVLKSTGLDRAETFTTELKLGNLISRMESLQTTLGERTTIKYELTLLKDEAENITAKCKRTGQTACGNMKIDFGVVNEDSIDFDIDEVKKFETNLKDMNDNIEQIKDKISSAFTDVKSEIQNEVSDQEPEIKKIVKEIEGSVSEVSRKLRSFMENESNNMEKSRAQTALKDIRTYVWGGMVGYAIFPTILTVGLLLGLLCGICGHSSDRQPDERKCLSHTGGLCLLASVYFFLCFAAIWMLVLISLFVAGGSGRWYVCKLVETNKLEKFDMILDVYKNASGQRDNSAMLELLKPGAIVKKCSDNASLFEVVNAANLNLAGVDQLQKKLDDGIVKAKDKAKIGEEFKNYITDIEAKINEFKDKELMFENELNKTEVMENITTSLKEVENKLSEAKKINTSTISDDDIKEEIKNFVEKIEKVEKKIISLRKDVENATNFLNSLRSPLAKVQNDVDYINNELSNNITGKIDNIAEKELQNLTLNVNDIAKDVFGDVGGCRPIYEVYQILSVLVCNLVLDPLNGYIIGMGACLVFYIPALIVGMKLSKHYLKVTPEFKGSWVLQNGRNETIEMSDVSDGPRKKAGAYKNGSPRKQQNGKPYMGGKGNGPNYHY